MYFYGRHAIQGENKQISKAKNKNKTMATKTTIIVNYFLFIYVKLQCIIYLC